MGGDRAPGEIVAGARRAHEQDGIPVILVGRPEEIGDAGPLEVIAASEVIAMDADAGSSVRRMKDSSLVRAAEAAARADSAVARHLADRPLRKVVWVPGRLLNFVVGDVA